MRQSFRYRGTTPRQAFCIIILLFVLLISILVGFLSWHNHIIYQGNVVIVSKDTKTDTQESQEAEQEDAQEIDEEISQEDTDESSSVDSSLLNMQQEVSKEVLDFMENKLDIVITDIDNNKTFAELEENIIKIAMSKIDKKKLVRLAQKLGQNYVDDLKKKGYAKIRTTIDKKYDEEYIDEIISKVLPKLIPYYKDILRRYVINSIYSKITDEALESIAEEILNDLRTEYATKLREESEKMVDEFLLKLDNIENDDSEKSKNDKDNPKNSSDNNANTQNKQTQNKSPKITQPQTPKTRLNRQN